MNKTKRAVSLIVIDLKKPKTEINQETREFCPALDKSEFW